MPAAAAMSACAHRTASSFVYRAGILSHLDDDDIQLRGLTGMWHCFCAKAQQPCPRVMMWGMPVRFNKNFNLNASFIACFRDHCCSGVFAGPVLAAIDLSENLTEQQKETKLHNSTTSNQCKPFRNRQSTIIIAMIDSNEHAGCMHVTSSNTIHRPYAGRRTIRLRGRSTNRYIGSASSSVPAVAIGDERAIHAHAA